MKQKMFWISIGIVLFLVLKIPACAGFFLFQSTSNCFTKFSLLNQLFQFC